ATLARIMAAVQGAHTAREMTRSGHFAQTPETLYRASGGVRARERANAQARSLAAAPHSLAAAAIRAVGRGTACRGIRSPPRFRGRVAAQRVEGFARRRAGARAGGGAAC